MDAVFGAFAAPPGPGGRALVARDDGDRLQVCLDGMLLFRARPDALAPALEASVLGWIVRTRPDAVPLHAAAIGWRDGAVVLVGDKGSGKSTLSALLGGAHDYLGDEVALIDHATLALTPLPKAATIKRGAFDLVAASRTWVDPIRGPVRYHLPPRPSRAPRSISALVWTSYAADVDGAVITPVAPGQAALALVEASFGGLGRTPEAITTIARLAAGPAFALAFADVASARAALADALGPPDEEAA